LKYGYFNYDPVGPSVFFYLDDNGQPRETQFHIAEPERLIEAISATISGGHIDHVLCNASGLGLADAISNHLSTQFEYNNCVFEINEK
jgi:hypothetical protein